MKLPAKESLGHPDHLFLYGHDCRELHNQDERADSRLMYVTRFESVVGAVAAFAQGRRVLDVGCAQGNIALTLAEQGYEVVAVDLRHSFLQYLLLKYESGRISCVTGTVEHLPFHRKVFDVVVLGEVIEHVAYPEKLIEDVAILLKAGGILVVTTPNGRRLRTGLPTLSKVKDRRELVNRQFQPDADGHLFLLTRRELAKMVVDAGLSVKAHWVLCTPWVTGRLRFRELTKFVPVGLRRMLEEVTRRAPGVAELVAESQVLIAEQA